MKIFSCAGKRYNAISDRLRIHCEISKIIDPLKINSEFRIFKVKKQIYIAAQECQYDFVSSRLETCLRF